jgi:hypothetical protein
VARESVVSFEQLTRIVHCSLEKESLSKLRDGLSDYQVMYLVRKGAQSLVTGKATRQRRQKKVARALEFYERAQEDPDLAVRAGLGTRA